MRHTVRSPFALAVLACLPLFVSPGQAAVVGYTPPAGYTAESLDLTADVVAVAGDGRLAVARGGAITVYDRVGPEGRAVLAEIADARLNSLGGLAFTADGLLLSENGAAKTVFHASLSDGTVTALAPAGSLPDVSQVRLRPSDGAVFAVSSGQPGHGAVYRVRNGAAEVVASGLGVGYLGGLAFDEAGNILVGDTNDPFFMGRAGRILALDPSGAPRDVFGLDGGGGSGLYDIARAVDGAIYATTGATITRLLGGEAAPFGVFAGSYPFPTDIATDPFGGLVINGGFTPVGGLFRVRPEAAAIPEPSSVLLIGLGLLGAMARRRRAQ